MAGSIANSEHSQSIGDTNRRWRQRLIDSGTMAKNPEGLLTFQKDHLFRTPSGAAMAVLGRRANGWTEWKDRQGRTLHQVKREPGSVDP